MSHKFQFTLRTLLIAVTVLAVLLGFGRWAWVWLSQDEYQVATLDCGDGRKIIITAESFWDMSQAVFYRVEADGTIVVPTTEFTRTSDGDTEHLRYHLVRAENDTLVGVVMKYPSDEATVVILHDFAKGESWPRLRGDEVSYMPSVQSKWQDYFDRLQRENPGVSTPSDFRR